MYIHGTTKSSLGFHVLNNKERFSSYNYVEHLKWRWSNLYKPRSTTYIGKNVKLAWNLKEKITKSWSQICVLEALFLGEERRRSLARHGEGGRKVICVSFHGHGGGDFVRMVKEKRESWEKMRWSERKWSWCIMSCWEFEELDGGIKAWEPTTLFLGAWAWSSFFTNGGGT